MAYTSLRTLHRPLAAAPDELRALCKNMKRGNTWVLLSLLLESPPEVVIGTYEWREGRVVLPPGQTIEWRTNDGWRKLTAIPFMALRNAVISLRGTLGHHGLRVGVWRSAEAGHGEPGHGRLPGYRYTRERVPFRVGLVDRRTRLPRKGRSRVA